MEPFEVKERLVNPQLFETLNVVADDCHDGARNFAISGRIGRYYYGLRAEPFSLRGWHCRTNAEDACFV